jgi:tetratricopeptide (TPR) repeat protein
MRPAAEAAIGYIVALRIALLFAAALPALCQGWGRLESQVPWLQGRFLDAKRIFAVRRTQVPFLARPMEMDLWEGEMEMERGDYAQANTLLRRSRDVDHEVTDRRLARLRFLQGEIQAAEKILLTYTKWDGQRVEKLSLSSPVSLLTLGEIYFVRGRYVQARAIFQKAVERGRKSRSFAIWEWVEAQIALARTEAILGETAAADIIAEAAWEQARKTWGNSSLPAIDALDVVTSIRLAESKASEAERMANAVLEARQSIYGERHVKVAQSLLQLARVHAALGEHGMAILLADRALQTYHETFTGLNVWSALALTESAAVYEACGRHTDAQRQYRDALTVLDRFLGAETPAVQAIRGRVDP